MEYAPNYFCTWYAQNFGRPDCASAKSSELFLGQDGAELARNYLGEESLFGPEGIARQYDEQTRKKLYFLLDDGWDVPRGVHPRLAIDRFGSLELDEGRFPSFPGTPAERLRKLNEYLIRLGWRGAALWVAAQGVGESWERGFRTPQQDEKYWSERLRWSDAAGIGYWKIDWGCRQHELAWCERIHALRDRYAPNLRLEKAYPPSAPNSPLHDVSFDAQGRQVTRGWFADWGEQTALWKQMLVRSDIFRSYDVMSEFSTVTTVGRVAELLQCPGGLLNCEDEVYLAAAMGCTTGIMRSPCCGDIPVFQYDPQSVCRRTEEAGFALDWQTFAPPVEVGTLPVYTSAETVTDEHTYHSGETWQADYIGKTLHQTCPAVVSRGMALPKLDCLEAERPVVCTMTHPNGAVSALIMPRHLNGGYRTPRAAVTLDVRLGTPVGLFGCWEQVSLRLPAFSRAELWSHKAQDWREAVMFAQDVRMDGTESVVTLSRERLEALCPRADRSMPAVFLRFC